MNVKLLTSAEHIAAMERNAALGALTCRGNADKEFTPREVLAKIIAAGHESVLEHINLTYSVKWLSRACLQELARHRHISLSVESTRHTLRKYLADEEAITALKSTVAIAKRDCINALECLIDLYPDISNDELKYYLPEFWPVNLILTSNLRELRHIIKLRTAPAALKEFRDLARAIYEAVPEEFKYLLADCVYKEEIA